ncbi:MAG: ATP-binding protein, partial [Elusimicrobiota bacterium]
LAAIESYLDLMASEAPAATRDARLWLEDLGRMRTTTTHLRRTIGDILDMTRVSDGRVKLLLRPLDVRALLDETAAAYAAHARARGVALSVEPGDAEVMVKADRDRLRQVLDNLVGNALKFTPPGACVRLSARRDGDSAALEVRDEGVGVPSDKHGQLFGKFSRLAPALDGTAGTGLGLYISRTLMEAQGGRLDYEPGPGGRGSVFRASLPRLARE